MNVIKRYKHTIQVILFALMTHNTIWSLHQSWCCCVG